MPFYRVNLEQVEEAIAVLKRQRITLEEQLLPERMGALNRDLLQGYPRIAMELQRAMDESNTSTRALSTPYKELEGALAAILTTSKQ